MTSYFTYFAEHFFLQAACLSDPPEAKHHQGAELLNKAFAANATTCPISTDEEGSLIQPQFRHHT